MEKIKLSNLVSEIKNVLNEQSNISWQPCIKELLINKEIQIVKSLSGQISAKMTPTEYPKGLQFYPNGRVMDVGTKKMGTWKCKKKSINTQTEITSTLFDDYLIKLETLIKNTTPDSLQKVIDMLSSLKGKTFNGNNAVQTLFNKYKQKNGVDFLVDLQKLHTLYRANVIGDKKTEIVNLLKSFVQERKNNKIGLKNIELNFSSSLSSKKKSYINCNDKPLPHAYGCKSDMVKRVQMCLGLPKKYQTGNFGPITKRAIEDKNIDLSNGLTQNVVNTICGQIKQSQSVGVDNNSPSTKPLIPLPNNKTNTINGAKLYDALKNNGNLKGEEGNRRIKYLGPDLDETNLSALDGFLSKSGYNRIKQINKNNDESKYVWLKQ